MKVLKIILLTIAYLFLGYWIIAWLWPVIVWLDEGHVYYFYEIIAGLCNFIAQLIVFYIGWDHHVRKLERERGEDNIIWEAGKGADLIASALIAFCTASALTLILLLSWLIGFKINLPLWFLIIYALVTGFGYACVFIYNVRSTDQDDTTKVGDIFVLIFPIVNPLFLHFIDFFL